MSDVSSHLRRKCAQMLPVSLFCGFLAKANEGNVPESLAYWMHEGTLDSQRSLFLCLLDKPKQAVQAASDAQARFDRTFVRSYGPAKCD